MIIMLISTGSNIGLKNCASFFPTKIEIIK